MPPPGPSWLSLPVSPVPKPRQTRRDQWIVRSPVAKYRAYADHLRLLTPPRWVEQMVMEGADMLFCLPVAKRRTAMVGQPHRQTPDVDNLVKGVLDALLPHGDEAVYRVSAAKLWTEEGSVWIGPWGDLSRLFASPP